MAALCLASPQPATPTSDRFSTGRRWPTPRGRLLFGVVMASFLGLALLTCTPPLSPDDVRLVPSQFLVVTDVPDTGRAGDTLSGPASLRILDQHGEPFPGIRIVFTALSNSGSLIGASDTTDGAGVVTIGKWILPD